MRRAIVLGITIGPCIHLSGATVLQPSSHGDCKTFNPFIIALATHRGPKPDVKEFIGLLEYARRRLALRVLVASIVYDWESNPEFCRQNIGARTIIPARHGSPTDHPALGKYRRLIQNRFDKKLMVNELKPKTDSMLKHLPGNPIKGKTYWPPSRDL